MKFNHPDAAVRAYANAIKTAGIPSRSTVSHGREYEIRCEKNSCKTARARMRREARRINRNRLRMIADCQTTGDAAEATRLTDLPVMSVHDWVDFYSAKSKQIEMRCAFCMRPRHWVDSYILGGNGGGKKGRPPGAMVRAADLAQLSSEIEALAGCDVLGPIASEIYIRHAAFGLSYDLTASDCTEIGVGGRHWTADQVKQIVRRSRRKLEVRLVNRGLMAGKLDRRGWKRAGSA